jgi:glycosyltransferase involved in cell wall biosynthesis
MRAAIFNPYLDTLGGGERYSLAVALALADKGYHVDVQWKSPSIKKRLEERFGMELGLVNFVKDVKRGDGYDVCFWVSDGSIPTLLARKNFLHFQVPFHGVNGKTLLNKMKLWRIKKIIVNSKFTKGVIDQEFGVDSVVIYPPVPVEKIKPKRKENIILFVGRFSELKQAKNQDVLVKAFKRLYDSGFREWRLILAGGAEVGGRDYIKKIKRMSEGYPIEIIESPSFKEIIDLYGRAKIFWSAVGFGTKEEKEPEKVEHFGISLVEAMAAGATPVVYAAGGYKEIVKDSENGYLWKDIRGLLKITKKLIADKGGLVKISRQARTDSAKFGYLKFKQEFINLI